MKMNVVALLLIATTLVGCTSAPLPALVAGASSYELTERTAQGDQRIAAGMVEDHVPLLFAYRDEYPVLQSRDANGTYAQQTLIAIAPLRYNEVGQVMIEVDLVEQAFDGMGESTHFVTAVTPGQKTVIAQGERGQQYLLTLRR